MNKIEKFVYNLVKRTPGIKLLIRNLYQSIFDILPKKKEFFSKPYQYKEHFFFGFHDLDPFSSDCTKILANHASIDMHMPGKEDILNVGYINFTDDKMGDFYSLGNSFAWNYHKGCRLQWLSNSKIIFNTAVEDKLISKIVDIEIADERVINFPIDTIHKEKMLATSFSYERLERCMPGYGYLYQDDGFLNDYAPEETGLFIVDIQQNTRILLISIAELVKNLNDKRYETNYWHFITHSEFSKDGRYISCFHRWIGEDINKRWTRMIIYDLQENAWFTLPTTNWGISHYVWNNNNQILGYCNIDNVDCHVLFNIPSNEYKKIAVTELNSDGHQSFFGNDEFVTDTYSDKYRMVKLYKVDISTNKIEELVSIYSPKQFQTKSYYNHIACDLHPRVSKNGNYLCFDSPRTGIRSLYVMKTN